MQGPSRGHPPPLPAPARCFTFAPLKTRTGFSPGQRAGIRQAPVELGKKQAGTRGCCSGCRDRSCCDWPTGSSWRCCSSCRPGSRGSSLWRKPGCLALNPAKTRHDVPSETGAFRTPCKLNQGRHVHGQRLVVPLAFQKSVFVLPESPPLVPRLCLGMHTERLRLSSSITRHLLLPIMLPFTLSSYWRPYLKNRGGARERGERIGLIPCSMPWPPGPGIGNPKLGQVEAHAVPLTFSHLSEP